MNITNRAQQLIQRITTNNVTGFGTSVIFVNPDNTITKTVSALQTKHMLKQDENGFRSVARTASIAVSEAALIEAGYPTRNMQNEVDLLQHKVTWTDVSGLEWTYSVRQNRPDENIGLIVLILDDYDAPTIPVKVIVGYGELKVYVDIVTTPDDTTQTLDNGDVIPLQYALNEDGSFTVPYVRDTVNCFVLVPFIVGNDNYQERFDNNGTFTFTYGSIVPGDQIAFNINAPIYSF